MGVWPSIEVQCSAGSSLISANLVLTTFHQSLKMEITKNYKTAIDIMKVCLYLLLNGIRGNLPNEALAWFYKRSTLAEA